VPCGSNVAEQQLSAPKASAKRKRQGGPAGKGAAKKGKGDAVGGAVPAAARPPDSSDEEAARLACAAHSQEDDTLLDKVRVYTRAGPRSKVLGAAPPD
jgi:hypothetical protein